MPQQIRSAGALGGADPRSARDARVPLPEAESDLSDMDTQLPEIPNGPISEPQPKQSKRLHPAENEPGLNRATDCRKLAHPCSHHHVRNVRIFLLTTSIDLGYTSAREFDRGGVSTI